MEGQLPPTTAKDALGVWGVESGFGQDEREIQPCVVHKGSKLPGVAVFTTLQYRLKHIPTFELCSVFICASKRNCSDSNSLTYKKCETNNRNECDLIQLMTVIYLKTFYK